MPPDIVGRIERLYPKRVNPVLHIVDVHVLLVAGGRQIPTVVGERHLRDYAVRPVVAAQGQELLQGQQKAVGVLAPGADVPVAGADRHGLDLHGTAHH